MGNTIQTGINDIGKLTTKNRPIFFHNTHSDNVEMSADFHKARRLTTFCKGICFSARPISPMERVHLRVTDVSTLWSGAVRFGFTSHDPATLDGSTLPRYACPDLTNKPGYWAKALPERLASRGCIITFHFTRSGDVIYNIDGEDKGVFLSGVETVHNLWAIIDIYGNTTAVEFVDGLQSNSTTQAAPIASAEITVVPPVHTTNSSTHSILLQPAETSDGPATTAVKFSNARDVPVPDIGLAKVPSFRSQQISATRWTNLSPLMPMSFHPNVTGHNAIVSQDGTVAVRRAHEYCNAYVFMQTPCILGDAICVSIISVDASFSGSLAFGLTCCDPAMLRPDLLPEDSDLLLDRPEYWVVNKDVCAKPEVGDQLAFQLTKDGEVLYGRNGNAHRISTLMHVDVSLPLWAFFDIYGAVQKIKLLGVFHGGSLVLRDVCTTARTNDVLLPSTVPRRRESSMASTSCRVSTLPPPPRPPPPRHLVTRHRHSPPPPALPPKERHGPSFLPQSSAAEGADDFLSHQLVPPPLPRPRQKRPDMSPGGSLPASPVDSPGTMGLSRSPTVESRAMGIGSSGRLAQKSVPLLPTEPATAGNKADASDSAISPAKTVSADQILASSRKSPSNQSLSMARVVEMATDGLPVSGECSVCLERVPDCVLYTCGHMCMCYDCALRVQRAAVGCPICRLEIKDVIKIYRS